MSTILTIGDACFVHMPKTGGSSIRAISEKYLKEEVLQVSVHDTVGHPNSFRIRQYTQNKFQYFTFVRNPFDWFKSVWKYWSKHRNIRPDAHRTIEDPFCFWNITFTKRLLYLIHEDSFETSLLFLHHYDRFLLHDVYSSYTNGVDFIGKIENLNGDFVSFLTKINNKNYVEFNNKVQKEPKYNHTDDMEIPAFSDELKQRFIEDNMSLYHRYEYEVN